jgi:hypothetical protein
MTWIVPDPYESIAASTESVKELTEYRIRLHGYMKHLHDLLAYEDGAYTDHADMSRELEHLTLCKRKIDWIDTQLKTLEAGQPPVRQKAPPKLEWWEVPSELTDQKLNERCGVDDAQSDDHFDRMARVDFYVSSAIAIGIALLGAVHLLALIPWHF